MLDTAGKGSGALLDHLDLGALARFVEAAKAEGLTVGLAGSLKAHHVPDLLGLGPDLIGFRGALCRGGARAAAIDPEACAGIRALIPRPSRALADTDLPRRGAEALC
jgi:dihydroneopterin aldolase